jgi:hypothetical protein
MTVLWWGRCFTNFQSTPSFSIEWHTHHTDWRCVYVSITVVIRVREKWLDQFVLNLFCLVLPLFNSVFWKKVGVLFFLTCILARYFFFFFHCFCNWNVTSWLYFSRNDYDSCESVMLFNLYNNIIGDKYN